MRIEKLDSVESTNKYCEALDLAQVGDFTCYWALEQTAGVGQRGNHWTSAPGENLTFSLVLHPTFLPADRQFKLTQALSLAICDFLLFNSSPKIGEGDRREAVGEEYEFNSGEGWYAVGSVRQPREAVGEEYDRPSIKWPNDIYVMISNTTVGSECYHYKKICGTLVSTRLVGSSIASAVCGIGLNVNQCEFPDWVPNPTSLSLLTGNRYDLEPLLQQLLVCIERRYNELKSGCDPEQEYLDRLLNLGVPARYKYMNTQSSSSPRVGEGDRRAAVVEEYLTATITGVDPHGRLLLTTADGRRLSCGMKEIALL